MKLWQLIAVQIWVLSFSPAWFFISSFSLLLLTPEPRWFAFVLINIPPVLSVIGSITMWVAYFNDLIILQKRMVNFLMIFPPIAAVIPFILY